LSTTNFHIINASAGSGKTHTLVLEYLKILLRQETTHAFRNMLALTFTNKAVHEMKARILETLFSLSHPPSKEIHMAKSLCEGLSISEKELAVRSAQMLRKILLEYGSFDVITLDTFTHRLVRTFARDFELPYGFEVVLDPTYLFEETVHSIIAQVGKEKSLSDLLLAFSLNKVKSEKDWDVQKDLFDFIPLLLNENDREPIADIKDKTLESLQADKRQLETALEEAKKNAIQNATAALTFLDQKGLKGR
jgi:ATP-dependent exoDNAse (exonuclease V) beta subunit